MTFGLNQGMGYSRLTSLPICTNRPLKTIKKLKKMNQPLLKDILFEKVENSHALKTDIFYAIVENIELDPEKDSKPVSDAANEIISLITEFVNQNYTPKTNEINPQL